MREFVCVKRVVIKADTNGGGMQSNIFKIAKDGRTCARLVGCLLILSEFEMFCQKKLFKNLIRFTSLRRCCSSKSCSDTNVLYTQTPWTSSMVSVKQE